MHYGVLSYDCKNESQYIDKAEELTREILQADEYELDDLFWDNPPDKENLDFTLKRILENIKKI